LFKRTNTLEVFSLQVSYYLNVSVLGYGTFLFFWVDTTFPRNVTCPFRVEKISTKKVSLESVGYTAHSTAEVCTRKGG
jgi:hypothetical protein